MFLYSSTLLVFNLNCHWPFQLLQLFSLTCFLVVVSKLWKGRHKSTITLCKLSPALLLFTISLDTRTPYPTYFSSLYGRECGGIYSSVCLWRKASIYMDNPQVPCAPRSKCLQWRESVHSKALAPKHHLSSCLTSSPCSLFTHISLSSLISVPAPGC